MRRDQLSKEKTFIGTMNGKTKQLVEILEQLGGLLEEIHQQPETQADQCIAKNLAVEMLSLIHLNKDALNILIAGPTCEEDYKVIKQAKKQARYARAERAAEQEEIRHREERIQERWKAWLLQEQYNNAKVHGFKVGKKIKLVLTGMPTRETSYQDVVATNKHTIKKKSPLISKKSNHMQRGVYKRYVNNRPYIKKKKKLLKIRTLTRKTARRMKYDM